MAQSTQNQQREFARVDDVLPLAWRRIHPARYAEVMDYHKKNHAFPPNVTEINQFLSAMDVTDKLRQLQQSDPILASILVRLDQKLNLLLRLFHPGETERPMVLTPVNLSGGGIAFLDRNPGVAIEEILEMRLALSADSLLLIECYSRVMVVNENEQPGLTRVACRFEPILDPDRERLIQYIFKRQSELLRAKRGF